MNRSESAKTPDRLVIACEESPTALAYARVVVGQILALHPKVNVEIRAIRSGAGAKRARGSGGNSLRVLERRSVDAVIALGDHLLGDLPAGLELAAVVERLAPFLACVSCEGALVDDLPVGAKVGVRSELARFQLSDYRSDLNPVLLRQSLEGPLKRVMSGGLDALLAPVADLELLGWQDLVSEVLDSSLFLPAPCQGVVALVSSESNSRSEKWIKPLDDATTRMAVEAERALAREMTVLDGFLGALAQISGSMISLEGGVWNPDGTEVVRDAVVGDVGAGEDLGRLLAEKLCEHGASEFVRRNRRDARMVGKVPESSTTGE